MFVSDSKSHRVQVYSIDSNPDPDPDPSPHPGPDPNPDLNPNPDLTLILTLTLMLQVYSMDANAVASPGKQPVDWTKVHTAEKSTTPRLHALTDINSLRMSLPCQLAVDSQQNNLMVADTNNHRVLVIRLDDTYDVVRQFGSLGSGNCEFKYPWGLAVDEEDSRLVVVDTMNNRCLIYVGAAQLWLLLCRVCSPCTWMLDDHIALQDSDLEYGWRAR